MANWQRTIRLQPEWGAADRREISPQELARSIAAKLRAVPSFSAYPEVNEDRDFLVEEFEDFAADDTGDFDDIDELVDRLYDWGDTHLSGQFFNAKKVCWIDAMSEAD